MTEGPFNPTILPGAQTSAEAIADATAAQQRATEPETTVWVNASAGTGKTKVLTDRVLRLLVAGSAPDCLLCITFTKAAAANMAERVRTTLATWATGAQEKLQTSLTGLLGRTASQEEINRARHLFAAVLDAPGGLKIMTIHAFCQSLLRRFPVEAGLSPHFELIEDRAAAELLHSVRTDLLANPPPDCDEAVHRLALAASEEQIDELITNVLRNRATLVRLIGQAGTVDALIGRLAAHFGVDPGDRAGDTVADACADGSFDGNGLRHAAAVLAEASKASARLAATIQDWLAADAADRRARWADYRGCFLTGKGEVRAQSFMNAKTVKTDPAAATALGAEADRILAVEDALKRQENFANNAALYRLAGALIDRYEAAKHARGVLDYDDLIIRADALLNTPGRAAWVLYKLDRGIDHVLIDEAQDTNPEQWELVAALVEEFFAGAGARDDDAPVRTLFVVGDEKQSIFAFQGADPAAFAATRDRVAERVAAAGQGFDEVPLTISFRSVQAVLDAVDATFMENAEALGLGDRYQPHRAARAGSAGRVELWPEVPAAEKPPSGTWQPPLERDQARPAAMRLADTIAAQVADWIGQAELPALGRPLAPGDVLILVRKRDVFFQEMVRALKRRSVPVAGVDRMTLSAQLAIQDLMVLGDVLLLPGDDLALATVLRGPLVDLDEAALFDLAHGRPARLWDALRAGADTDATLAAIVDWLREMMNQADYRGPLGLFAHILARPCPADPGGSGRRALLARLGHDAEDPIDEFIDLADRFEQGQASSLQRFLHWLRAAETDIKREMEAGAGDAVRLMTVHGAKGLQGRLVILADTKVRESTRPALLWPRDGSPLPLWLRSKDTHDSVSKAAVDAYDHRRREEDKRLLYVAMTRAEDWLVVTGIEGGKAQGKDDAPPSLRWHPLVARGLAAMPGATPVEHDGWEGERLILTQPQSAPVEDAGDARPAEPPAMPVPDALRRPPPDEPEPPRPLAPSRPAEPEPSTRSPVTREGQGRFKRGTLIHNLLQYLPEMPAGRRADAASAYLAQPGHDLDQAAQRTYAEEVMAVLDDPAFAALFGPDSRAEVPITARLGSRVISGQIDRIVVTDQAVTVLDWKTNRPPPDRPAEVATQYLGQMASYRAALRQLFPGRRIDCVLGWTDGPRLMALPDALLDDHAPPM